MCKELARNQMKSKMSFLQLENKFGIDRMFKLCSVPATIQSEGLSLLILAGLTIGN